MVPFFLIFVAIIAVMAGIYTVPKQDRVFLFRLALLAFLLRVLFIIATQSFDTAFIQYVQSSDAQYYQYMGRLVADAWNEGRSYTIYKSNYGYYYWNGLIYYLVGYKPDFVRVLNSVVAVCTGFNLYFMALKLSGERAAKISFVLAVFFPSSILWSSLNLKDSLIIFLITLIIKKSIELMEKFSPAKVILISVLLMALVSLRFYAGIILAITISLSYVFTATKFLLWQRFVYALVLFFFAGFVLQQMGYGFLGTDYLFSQNIETIGEQHARGAYGSAAFADNVTFDSYTDALKYLPVGVFYFLFSPLPWQSVGPIRIITIPEMLFLYFSYGYLVIGLKHLWRTHRGPCLFLLLVIAFFGLIYSLGSSNIGGLYRVRLQVIMIAFIFIGSGMQKSWALSRIFGRLVKRKSF